MVIIFCACDLGGCAVRIWEEDAWIRRPGEWVVRQDAEILRGCENHSQVAMVAASQGGWD